ncbi:MAG: 6-O-methylguanine DNA methyltransferase [Candidatus Vogelbacteria bacterium CG10_big_fil_rev_8_21_14_0_10_51_16]|uniref:Methylated-DNA--protein-cysteine methyltransferase n=1 Tax=Candidatus Vogelbacteria bacterium CG10_big_fil_rev_8_21_14_0_10_51_16 TaxID=1975045 RepID=A0A2H0RFW8_9BACT|nr:MAG: 6-O-methylguanine DNA methyltransferase [Candidatus Vogelbacteria bacterium CG10_big_fil_rev_8_21_14_0_10_51_16]
MKSFRERVLVVVSSIPKGHTATYAQVAAKAGNPKAARAIGTIMRKNFNPLIPCHRVVRSDGTVGEYNRGGPGAKTKLLHTESATLRHS